MDYFSPRVIFLGKLTRDFTILPSSKALIDVPGGNVLFAAVGLKIWEGESVPGIVARVGEDYPREWLYDFALWGLDPKGVRVQPEPIDVRCFMVYADITHPADQAHPADVSTPYQDDPVVHFARLGLPFPKALLGYRPPNLNIDSRTRLLPTSLRQGDIPGDFLDATYAHLCPGDFLTHSLMPAILRQAEFTTITLDPSSGYMNPTFFGDIPVLLTGLTAFMPSEDEIRSLFQGKSTDLWEMMEALTAYGCEIIIVKRGLNGQWVYDSATRSHWEIPSYPARVTNPTGAGDAFCGGFLAGFRRTYEPLVAAMQGNISASLVIEGDPPNFALDALPGLAQARLEALQTAVRKV
jgi:ribokinase